MSLEEKSPNLDIGSKHSSDLEANNTSAVDVSPEMDKKLRWKADIFITFLIALVYGAQTANRLISTPAGSLGVNLKFFTLNPSGAKWVDDAFFLAYIIVVVPISVLYIKLPLVHYFNIMAVISGIVVTCTAACSNKGGYIACRTLIGIFQSATIPALVVFTIQWYKRSEIFTRVCLWLSISAICDLIADAICAGLAHHTLKNPLAYSIMPWKIIYIIVGLVTFVFGLVGYFVLPNSPREARFLKENEKEAQVQRVVNENFQCVDNFTFKSSQVVEALTDIRVLLYGITLLLASLPNSGSMTVEFLVFQMKRYSGSKPLAMSLPNFAIQFGGVFIPGMLAASGVVTSKICFTMFAALISLVSIGLTGWGGLNAKLGGCYLYAFSGPLTLVGLTAIMICDTPGMTKRLTATGFMFMCYGIGNIVGPEAFKKTEAPHFDSLRITLIVTQCVVIGLIGCLFLLNMTTNKNRSGKPSTPVSEDIDITDKEMDWFRYSL